MKRWDEVMRKKSQCVCVRRGGCWDWMWMELRGWNIYQQVAQLLTYTCGFTPKNGPQASVTLFPSAWSLMRWGPFFLSFSIPFKSESAEKTHTDLLTLHVRCSECEQAFRDVKRPPLFTSYCPCACLYVLHGAQLIFTLPRQPKTHVMFFRGYPMIPDTNSDCEVPASPNTKKPILEN